MPLVRRISSRSVAQNEPLPGLSLTTSPGSGASSGMISQPGSPRTIGENECHHAAFTIRLTG